MLGPKLHMEGTNMNGQQNVFILQKENTYPGELGVSEKILQVLFVFIFKLALCSFLFLYFLYDDYTIRETYAYDFKINIQG